MFHNTNLAVFLLRTSLLSILLTSLLGCAPMLVVGGATAASVAHDRRTTGTVVEDQSIRLKAIQALQKQGQRIGRTHINVRSYNGIVLLTGEADTEELKDWAGQTVASIDKVRRVHNEIVIGPPSSIASRTNDSWISTKATTSLLQIGGIPDFDPTRVKITTERGVVYLMGLVRETESDAVTSTVRRVPGVQRLVKLFEIF